MPGLLKIGFTDRSIEQRLDELDSATGVAWPFELEFCIRVSNAHHLERRLHHELRDFRVRADREFFQLSNEEAVKRILALLTPAELLAPPPTEEPKSIHPNSRLITAPRRRRVRRTSGDIPERTETTHRISGERTPRSNSGARLNEEWKIGAAHCLYRKTGNWYMPLEFFPGALCDENGYILFKSESDYRSCIYLQIGKQVSVPLGISKIPGYVRMR